MGHHHHHDHSSKNIGVTIVLNLGITIAQIIGGIISGSMALLSDAAHNFSDVLSLIISWAARRLAGQKLTANRTFGFKRAEIFAAFINSTTLIVIAVILAFEAVKRLMHPQEIEGNIVIWLAGLSILVNGLSVLLIKKDAKNSMNMKSAYLHLFTDMLTSIAVLIGGILMMYFGWYWVDGVLSLGIAVFLVYSSWAIFAESLKIMMQFTPKSVDIEKIAIYVQKINGLKNIHHIHVWQLDEHEIIFEAHVDLENDIHVSEFEIILKEINKILHQYEINHCNIQPEYSMEDSKDLINNQGH
ncbi:MAG: cation transporter [Bacteroidetes bacterium]|nr:MAG: cation transporter [Bacteroidota bacterium]